MIKILITLDDLEYYNDIKPLKVIYIELIH